jgi:hypothetical protein
MNKQILSGRRQRPRHARLTPPHRPRPAPHAVDRMSPRASVAPDGRTVIQPI